MNGFTNTDMRKYFFNQQEKSSRDRDKTFYENKIANYDKRTKEIDSLGSFQLFEFSDLIDFAGSDLFNSVHRINKYDWSGRERSGKEILRELRNLAMHGKNPIVLNKETSIYSQESLQELMENLNVLCKEFAKVANKIRQHPDFLKSVELDNKNKLEIIHNHHPKALEYFMGFN